MTLIPIIGILTTLPYIIDTIYELTTKKKKHIHACIHTHYKMDQE